jgi:hypothetical protein
MCVVVNHFKRLIIPTHYCCEVKLNYLHIYVHSHYQKEYLIKSCILFLLEEYAECIPYLGECVQLIHLLVVIYCLWLVRLKIVE